MTEEEFLLEEEEKKPGLLSNPVAQIAIIVISLSVAVGLSAIISFMVAKKYKPYNLIINSEKEEELIPHKEALNFFKMGDFLVRLTDRDVPRYLKITNLLLAYERKKYKEIDLEIRERKARIKDLINNILLKKSSDVATYEGKMALKKELVSEINKVMNPKKGKIEDIYMEILIQ